MYEVIVSTVSTGRVVRRRFPSRGSAETWRRRVEEVVLRIAKAGLRSVRVELERVRE